MFDLNLQHLTDAGAHDLAAGAHDLAASARSFAEGTRDAGAAATGNLLRIVESDTTRWLVAGGLSLGFCALAFYTLRELRVGATSRHEVIHRGETGRAEPTV